MLAEAMKTTEVLIVIWHDVVFFFVIVCLLPQWKPY